MKKIYHPHGQTVDDHSLCVDPVWGALDGYSVACVVVMKLQVETIYILYIISIFQLIA